MSKYYKTCPDCGSNLDPQEKCDCHDTHCEGCGNTLKWGKFAHNQELCWDCYKKKMSAVIKYLTEEGFTDDAERTSFAVACLAEIYGEEF